MSESTVIKNLDAMHEIDVQVERLAQEKQAKIDEILTHELRQQIKDIEEEFGPMINNANNNRKKLEEEARSIVLVLKKTVPSTFFRLNYCEGKLNKDAKKFEEYLEKHKDDEDFKACFTTGDPYTTLTPIKPKEKDAS